MSLRVQLDARGYDSQITAGIENAATFPLETWDSTQAQVESVCEERPDVVVVSGWMLRAYHALLDDQRLRSTRFIAALDNPWRGTLRQHLTRWSRRRYLRRMTFAVVAGERSRCYAEKIGIRRASIRMGAYCCDHELLSKAMDLRRASGRWPRRFLFVGRLDPVKGIEELLAGYRQYRALVSDPWPLALCGRGPLAEMAGRERGVELLGFVQPAELPQVLARHGAFVIASRNEPWGAAIAEACAAGLPVACSDCCGAGVDMVRDWSNGYVFAAGSSEGVRDALLALHRDEGRLEEMGALSQRLALPYSAAHWARRWGRYIREAASIAD